MVGKAAIIIVNWNGKRFLKDCLNSVFKQTYKNFDVYFVDNGSTDGGVKYVGEYFPKVKIIRLDKNYGFAKGNNEGIREAFKDKNVKYIVCLNNDTIVDKNWLKELVKTVEKDRKIGAVQSKILLPNGKLHTAGMRFVKDLQGKKDGGLSLGYKEDPRKFKEIMEIFAPCGASVLYKRKVLERTGLFDEDFHSYVEDFDLGWRIRKADYISIYCPTSIVKHFHSQTGGLASPFKAYQIKRNIYLTAIKNFDLIDLFFFPFRDIVWNIKNLRWRNTSVKTLKRKVGYFGMLLIILKAYLSVILYLPKMFIKRFGYLKE